MAEKKADWIDLSVRQPRSGQFVRVEVRERVENHWLEFEGQARYDGERGWLKADGKPYLTEQQQIQRWKPLLDSGSHDEFENLVEDLARE